MNNYLIGSDIVGADDVVTVQQQPSTKDQVQHFLNKPVVGGMRTWQIMLGSVGLACLVGGVITLAVKK